MLLSCSLPDPTQRVYGGGQAGIPETVSQGGPESQQALEKEALDAYKR